MKKIFIFLFLILSITVNAQINVLSESSSKIEKQKTLVTGYSDLYVEIEKSDTTYFIVTPSSNQFEDPIWFSLGIGFDQAKETVKQLISLLETHDKGYSIYIENNNKQIFMTINKLLGSKYFLCRPSNYAGTFHYDIHTINALKKYFNLL